MSTETVLVIPVQDREALLSIRLAGLDFFQRIVCTAQKAAVREIVFISTRPDQLPPVTPPGKILPGVGGLPNTPDTLFLVLSAGYLPDVDFLTDLVAAIEGSGPCVLKNSRMLFACNRSQLQEVSHLIGRPGGIVQAADLLEKSHGLPAAAVKRGMLYKVTEPTDIPFVEHCLFSSLVKETEGFMSRHVERRISLALSRRLVETGITPNQMTLISVAIGLVGALFIGMGGRAWQIAGSVLFLAHSILDGCDGEIARIKFEESRLGGILDFWGDNVVHGAVFYAIGHAWRVQTDSPWPLLLAVLAVTGTLASASLVYLKTMRTKKEGGPLYTSVAVAGQGHPMVRLADFLSRRDFIYLVVILSLFGHLDWFLILSAIGAPLFSLVLVRMYFHK